MDKESEEKILEKLGTIKVSDCDTEKQNVSSGQLTCDSASCRLSTVDSDALGASGNAERLLDDNANDQELAEEQFFECKEALETDGFADAEEDLTKLEHQNDETKTLEFDEEYLRELEKDLPEEEKKRRQNESLMLKEVGNGQFKKGEYPEAENSYTEALGICPGCNQKDRSILYSNRAAARMKLGNKEDAISDCTKAIELNPNYIRAILRRAELYEKTEKLDEALQDYKTIVEKDPSVVQAREACMENVKTERERELEREKQMATAMEKHEIGERLPQQIEERNEKMKEEMLGKLKDLGNMVLRPFGLSTDNFLLNKDPNSGSYSINFVQNPNNNNR